MSCSSRAAGSGQQHLPISSLCGRIRLQLGTAFIEHAADLWPESKRAATPEWIRAHVNDILRAAGADAASQRQCASAAASALAALAARRMRTWASWAVPVAFFAQRMP
jgi:hypothetical protein